MLPPRKLVQLEPACWVVRPLSAAAQLAPVTAVRPAERAGADPYGELSSALLEAKIVLDRIPERDYTQLARELDVYGALKRRLRAAYGLPVVTNATLKMYELLSTYGLLLDDKAATPPAAAASPAAAAAAPLGAAMATLPGSPLVVRAFCNAELPGAFLIALSQYVTGRLPRLTSSPVEFDWVASSYLPPAAATADTSYLDDQYGIYARHRSRWLMGPRPNALPAGEAPVSGDVTDSSVVAAIADAVHRRYGETGGPAAPRHSGATLYTSDAGIDVTSDYSSQEELTVVLNFGQVVCGLLSLAPGGALVTKQYTFFTEFNRELIALLSTLFDCLRIIKPVTSRPANSEVYLVGTGFRGVDRALADGLLDLLTEMREWESGRGDGAGRPHAGTAAGRFCLLRGGMAACPETDAQLLEIASELTRSQIKYLREIDLVYKAARAMRKPFHRTLKIFTEAAIETATTNWMAANPMARLVGDPV